MIPPIWKTTAGSLGTIPEGRFYQLPLQATSPYPPVKFKLIAGRLPAGIQVRLDGTIEGIPEAVAITQGVPLSVNENVTSKFTIRAYTETEVSPGLFVTNIADRTFLLTVTGQDAPRFVTPAGLLGTYLDSTEVFILLEDSTVSYGIPIEVEDLDQDPIVMTLVSGSLPKGLRIEGTSIVGIIEPDTTLPNTAVPGLESSDYDLYPFDFATIAIDKSYQFTLQISDGKETDRRAYSIFVVARNNLPTEYDVLNPISDQTVARPPFIITPEDLGSFRHDNFFAVQLKTVDFDGDQVAIEYLSSALPDFADGDFEDRLATGWLSGWLPDIGASEETVSFDVRAYKVSNPSITSRVYTLTMNIFGDIETEVVWNTQPDLGVIYTGEPSTLFVEATSIIGYEILYRLVSPDSSMGSNGLPAGLLLLPTGEIVGRPSLNRLRFDGGATTFDAELATRREVAPTTFDSRFTFTVNAYSTNDLVSVFREFTITIADSSIHPWESLYVKAMPPDNDRALLNTILSDEGVFVPDAIYRTTDPHFGVAKSVIYDHVYGITSYDLLTYANAVSQSHYRKRLTLGEVKTAQALDSAGNVVYEVVYADVVDDLAKRDGTSISKQVRLVGPYQNRPADANSVPQTFAYPNSLKNMRDRLVTQLGRVVPGLPLWMKSKQTDGRVLGFVPAWVIAYTKPGRAREVQYNLLQSYSQQLNTIDFYVDRYAIDKSLTYNWDPYAAPEYNDDLSSMIGDWDDSIPASPTSFSEASTISEFDHGNTNFDGFRDRFVFFPKRGIYK
jgi:hypothetical protein